MSTLEERLASHLHERAASAELRFGVDDLLGGHVGTRASQGDTGYRGALLAAAAVLAVVGGATAYVANPQITETIEAASIQETNELDITHEPTTPAAGLALATNGEVPQQLSDDAVILVAGQVGRIEVGSPSNALLAEKPWLKEARCVATATGVGCAAAEDALVGTGSGVESKTYGSHSGRGWHLILGPDISDPDGPFVFLDHGGSIVISGFPETASTVEATFDLASVLQRPVAGTAVFPLPESARNIRIVAYEVGGNQLWASPMFDPPYDEAND